MNSIFTQLRPVLVIFLVLFARIDLNAQAEPDDLRDQLLRMSIEWQNPVDETNQDLDRIPDSTITPLIDVYDLLALKQEWIQGTPTPTLTATFTPTLTSTPTPTLKPAPVPTLLQDIFNEDGDWPSIAADDNGDYVISYQRSGKIRYRKFNADGSKDGDEEQMENYTDRADVAVDREESLWLIYEYDSSYEELRIFHEEDQWYSFWDGAQRNPTIAVDRDQFAAVVWEDQNADDTQVLLGFARFQSGKVKLLEVYDISDNENDKQEEPDIAVNENDNFLAVWTRKKKEINAYLFQYYSLEDWPYSPSDDYEISTVVSTQIHPRVAALGNDFLVVWQDTRENSNGEIYGRIVLDTDRKKFGSNEIRLDDSPMSAKIPAVAGLSGLSPDRYLVVWVDGREGLFQQIRGVLIDASGNLLGPSFLLNESTNPIDRIDLTGSKSSNGEYMRDFVLTWEESGKIRALLFRIPE